MRADEMLEKGDLRGYAVWRRILKAVEELQRTEPAAGGRLRWPSITGMIGSRVSLNPNKAITRGGAWSREPARN